MVAATERLRRAPLAAAVAVAAALCAPQAAVAAGCPGAGANPNDVPLAQSQQTTLCLLNERRREHGLRALRSNGQLALASIRHSRDMVSHDYFEHGNFLGRIRSARYLSRARAWTVGENIAWGSGDLATPEAIVRAWMHSPGHRHNILDPHFREIGVGIARGTPGAGGGATYTTDFGARG